MGGFDRPLSFNAGSPREDFSLNRALFRSQNHEYNHAGAGKNQGERNKRYGEPAAPAPAHHGRTVEFFAGFK
jgi:hypothetical protein